MNKYFDVGIEVLKKLNDSGFEAYFVGGFVRDYVLGLESKDIDITTNALPEQVMKLFKKVIPTGLKFGTVTVMIGEHKYEVTTYRSDGLYIDRRRPEDVTFSNVLEEDLKRRDFSMNALCMDQNLKVIDYFNGLEDIKHKVIRSIGDPNVRFKEDALRIIRGLRFASKLGFQIEPNTLQAMTSNKELLNEIAIERIYTECNKLFSSKHVKHALEYMVETEVHKVLPGFELGISYLTQTQYHLTPIEYYAVIFAINGEFDERWKFSNKHKFMIKRAIDLAQVVLGGNWNRLLVYSYKLETCLLANTINFISKKDVNYEDHIKEMEQSLPIKEVCDLVFKGQDIWLLTDNQSGPWIGRLVDDIKFEVLMGHLPNDYEVLKQYTIKRMKEMGLEDLICH